MQPGKDKTGLGRWGWTKLKGKGGGGEDLHSLLTMQISWTINNVQTTSKIPG